MVKLLFAGAIALATVVFSSSALDAVHEQQVDLLRCEFAQAAPITGDQCRPTNPPTRCADAGTINYKEAWNWSRGPPIWQGPRLFHK